MRKWKLWFRKTMIPWMIFFFYLRYVTVTVSENNMSSFEYSYFIVIVVNVGWTKSALNKENTNLSELKKRCEINLTMLLWLGKKKKKKTLVGLFQPTQNFGKLGLLFLLLLFCLFACLFVCLFLIFNFAFLNKIVEITIFKMHCNCPKC